MSVRDVVQAAAGALGESTYIEDVFSTYLYTGNGSTQTITNGIDLSGEGGLVWTKKRQADDHCLVDTARGNTKMLYTNGTGAEITYTNQITAFNSNGYSVSSNAYVNGTGNTFASWTFRKAEKFFDVVTYTGDGTSGRAIPHNLGSVPGCIIVKQTDAVRSWPVFHRSLANGGTTENLFLNQTSAVAGNPYFPAVSSTTFSVSASSAVNTSGGTYVAYLFAHDAGGFGDDGSENVISCGSFTTDGSGNATVSLGYEPQYVMYKRSDGTGSWLMFDNMRGMTVNTTNGDAILFANLSDAESTVDWIQPTATGFNPYNIAWNATYIYIAIRRGPMKTPESGTSVFKPMYGTGGTPSFTTTFPVDLFIDGEPASNWQSYTGSRLQGGNLMYTNSTAAETSAFAANVKFDYSYGWGTSAFNSDHFSYCFGRAPGFFDVVCYTGDGSNPKTITHNLAAVPELMIVKRRNNTGSWLVYSAGIGATNYLVLNATDASTAGGVFNNATPTSSSFQVYGTSLNTNGGTYLAYLFATVAGVSKVGSYTGTGATQQINCGFTGGARFVLVKATSTTGNWLVWDAARGIVAGNDPYLALNSTAAEVTTTDWVDTYSAGFELSSASGNLANTNGVSYIFWAVA